MTDPAKPRLRIVEAVEDAFAELPPPADESEAKKRAGEKSICNRYYPSLVKRARAEERAALAAERARLEGQHAGQLEGVTKAHEAELKRVGKLIGKAAFRDGALWFFPVGMAFACAVIFGTYWVTKDMLFARTSADRVQHSLEAGQVPSLSDSYRNAEPPTGEPIRRAP